MIPVLETARRVQEYMRGARWEFAFIGGLAVNRWGQPRTTNDADVCLATGFGEEERFADALLERFAGRIRDAKEFALRSRVLLLRSDDGFGVDVSFGSLPFEIEAIERSSEYEFAEGIRLRTISAEDLVVQKAFAARDQDWIDVRGVFVRQGDALDIDAVRRNLRPLCELKEAPEALDRLDELWRTSRREL